MPVTLQAWVTLVGGLLVVMGSIWLVLKVLSKLTLHEEKQFIDDRAHRVISVRLESHNADPGAHAPVLGEMHEKLNETRETTIQNSAKLDQILGLALGGHLHVRRDDEPNRDGRG